MWVILDNRILGLGKVKNMSQVLVSKRLHILENAHAVGITSFLYNYIRYTVIIGRAILDQFNRDQM
jgi:hypothetical protein